MRDGRRDQNGGAFQRGFRPRGLRCDLASECVLAADAGSGMGFRVDLFPSYGEPILQIDTVNSVRSMFDLQIQI